ncbi:MAG: response regulator [Candidatus Competibacteraceae bacterium]|nr:response regulator [Candidatus Competibacteraceae bacterium]
MHKAKSLGKDTVYQFEVFNSKLEKQEKTKILLVDDEPKNIKILSAIFSHENFSTANANSGEEALNILSNYDADVVLLDVMMPGIDGFEVCRRIKENNYRGMTPVIMITAADDMVNKSRV